MRNFYSGLQILQSCATLAAGEKRWTFLYDYLIQNARILDGSGTDGFFGDVAVSGGSITAVGKLSGASAAHTIDAAGRYLTPGFIDIHRHGDSALFSPDYGKAELSQGLTTVLNGNCGLSLAPASGSYREALLHYLAPIVGGLPDGRDFPTVADYRAQAAACPQRLNNGLLVGMGTLRACVAGFRDGPLTDEEYHQLHTLLERSLADGALGVSLGLGYAPECFYDTAGLIRALEPLHGSGVTAAVHMRQEGDGVVDALREMLTVARALDTPVEISHLKAIGKRNWRRAVPEMLELLTRARENGLDIACDVYPYPAGSTQLIHTLPPEFQAGGIAALTEALRDPVRRMEMRRRMETASDFENISLLVGFENIRPTSLHRPQNRRFEGRTVLEIAAAQAKDPYDALFDLLAEEHCAASMIDTINHEEDIDGILRAPYSSVISDATYPGGGLLHRRVYGTFTRILETYVRKRRLLTLPDAVRKMTRQPADRFGLAKKGRVEPGADADLCLFDLERIHETDTWLEPEMLSQGMDYVFVNGVPAIAEGRFTDRFSGRIL